MSVASEAVGYMTSAVTSKVRGAKVGSFVYLASTPKAQKAIEDAALLAKQTGGVITRMIENKLHHAACFERDRANRGLTIRPVKGKRQSPY